MLMAVRDSAVTEYVRTRIREWEASGRDQTELASKAGLSAATISQVKTRIGVGSRSIDGFARALGFKSATELRSAAYSWFQQQGAEGSARAHEPAVVAAVATVRGLRADVTEAQIQTILFAFGHERFAGRDESFWVRTLLDELLLERHVMQATNAAAHAAQRDEAARRAQISGSLRAEHRRRKEAASRPPAPPAKAPRKAGAR